MALPFLCTFVTVLVSIQNHLSLSIGRCNFQRRRIHTCPLSRVTRSPFYFIPHLETDVLDHAYFSPLLPNDLCSRPVLPSKNHPLSDEALSIALWNQYESWNEVL